MNHGTAYSMWIMTVVQNIVLRPETKTHSAYDKTVLISGVDTIGEFILKHPMAGRSQSFHVQPYKIIKSCAS
jgi:hypothetical protein